MGTFCEACKPPRMARYEGTKLILERVDCRCKCPETVFGNRGPRCSVCDHPVEIELTDEWSDPLLWIDPKTRRPIKVNEVTIP